MKERKPGIMKKFKNSKFEVMVIERKTLSGTMTPHHVILAELIDGLMICKC